MGAAARGREVHSRQDDALILGGPPHMVVCIVSTLERVVGWAPCHRICCSLGVAYYELVRVYSDEGRAADARINGIREDPFTIQGVMESW